jgi:hypothetical protein
MEIWVTGREDVERGEGVEVVESEVAMTSEKREKKEKKGPWSRFWYHISFIRLRKRENIEMVFIFLAIREYRNRFI